MLLAAGFSAFAQGHRQLDSLAYILPEFCQGTVLFADGQVSHGVVNISPLDQAVYCITEAKDTVTALNYTNIISVSAGGRSFFKWKSSFVENVIIEGDSGVGIIRTTSKINNVKTGAYGMSSSTASIDSYSYDGRTGALHINIIDDPHNFVYKSTPALLKNGKYYSVSKKSFERLFPEQKSYIESVWEERSPVQSDVSDVVAFYKELVQRH